MTEFEIILLINENSNRLWTIMQFWTSVSFGLIVVAHIAVKKINLSMMVTVSCLYVLFSLFVLNMLKLSGGVSDGYLLDLQAIADTGRLLSNGGLRLISDNVDGSKLLLIVSVFFGTFVGTIVFLWYSFFSKNKKST